MMNGNTLLPDWLKQAISDATGARTWPVSPQPFANDADLALHASYRKLYRSACQTCHCFPFSGKFLCQRCLFCACFREALQIWCSHGGVGVLRPHSTVAGVVDGGPYTTFSEDWVINAVRFVYPNTLPANATTGTTPVDSLGHGFQTAYLAVPDARATILRNVRCNQSQDWSQSRNRQRALIQLVCR